MVHLGIFLVLAKGQRNGLQPVTGFAFNRLNALRCGRSFLWTVGRWRFAVPAGNEDGVSLQHFFQRDKIHA